MVPEGMAERLKAATFRLLLGVWMDPRKGVELEHYGTGFFVDEQGLALTAYHNLERCAPETLLRAVYQGKEVQLRWRKDLSLASADIAVLEWADARGAVRIQPLRVAFLDPRTSLRGRRTHFQGRAVLLYGFPVTNGGAVGRLMAGSVAADEPVAELVLGDSAAASERLRICGTRITELEGMSGAPVLYRETGRVIAVQVSYDVQWVEDEDGRQFWKGAGDVHGTEIAQLVQGHEVLAQSFERVELSPQFRARVAPTRLRHGAEHLFGRDRELARLDAAWADPATHILSIVAWGGAGKTSLVVESMARQAALGWPGFECVFDWCFYSLGVRQLAEASADAFITHALEFFGDRPMAQSAASPWDKGARLAQLVAQRRTLLVLDGIEPLQQPPGPLGGQLKDLALVALLRGLAQDNLGLCIVTTRERIAELAPFEATTAPVLELRDLPTAAAARLLRSLGVWGSSEGLMGLVQDVEGHALTLHLLGRYLAKAYGGDCSRRDQIAWDKADAAVEGGRAFRVLAAYEKWLATGGERGQRQLAVLRLLGFFNRPADPGCLAALRAAPAIEGLTEPLLDRRETDWNLSVADLVELDLVQTHAWQPTWIRGFNSEQAQALRAGVSGGDPHALAPAARSGPTANSRRRSDSRPPRNPTRRCSTPGRAGGIASCCWPSRRRLLGACNAGPMRRSPPAPPLSPLVRSSNVVAPSNNAPRRPWPSTNNTSMPA